MNDKGTESEPIPPVEGPAVAGPFKTPFDPARGLEDGRKPWDWKAKYPPEAATFINREAKITGAYLAGFVAASAICACLVSNTVDFSVFGVKFIASPSILLTYFMGGLGSTTFSIKWLIHSVATGKWHVERIYWRVFVPLVGGIYAMVVLGLMSGGFMGAGGGGALGAGSTWALAFLVGYFSDGVSGLLSNVANAVFGTVERK